MKSFTTRGSVRVDFLGGTLDLFPLFHLLQDTVTINAALTLQAEVTLSSLDAHKKGIEIISQDYNKIMFYPSADFHSENFYEQGLLSPFYFKEFFFVALLLRSFHVTEGLSITLSSGAPPGSGLGGSSAMGIALYKALCNWTGKKYVPQEAVTFVQEREAAILQAGVAGHQDYYPAVFGGILSLTPSLLQPFSVTQHHTLQLSEELEQKMSLIYSGQSRFSGINNWEVYKKFFDRDDHILRGMKKLAYLAKEGLGFLKEGDIDSFLGTIVQDGHLREHLFEHFVTKEMKILDQELRDHALLKEGYRGLKVCGAGGGGCFLLIGEFQSSDLEKSELEKILLKHNMKKLEFRILPPSINIEEE